MTGRVDASRDLLLGLYALEDRAIDRERLVSAIRTWARSPDRTLSEALADDGVLGAPELARLEDRVRRDLGSPEGVPEPAATVAYLGQPAGERREGAGRTPADAAANGNEEAGERFQILQLHARGGLGEIFLAFDGELNRSVALKELRAQRAHDPDSQARFLLEAKVTGKLEHPGIVPVYSLGRYADGRPYYAMRLIEGETLRDAIERFHRTRASSQGGDDRELAFRRLLKSIIDACNAVAYAHSRGVVHRDLKPENIMLGRFGETLVVDWGVAKSHAGIQGNETEPESAHLPTADASMTQPGSVIGTPRYMSPEQAAGELDRVGPASDIYSLGAILYCLLVGHAPVDGDVQTVLHRVRDGIFPSPRRVARGSVDPTLEAICLKAMAKDPRDRHASALELANDLEAWQADVRYRGEQELALNQVKGALTRLCLERAHNCFGREAHAEGMLWLARAVVNAPSEPPELQRAIRTSLHGWHVGVKLLERCFRHGGELHALAFCPEGRMLATACADGTARIWDVATGSPLSSPLRHDGPVRDVAFSPEGRQVITSGDDGAVRRWDALTGEPVGRPICHGAPVGVLSLGPDGLRIAVVGRPGRFILWDAATGQAVYAPTAEEPRAQVLAVAFSPDGATVAVASADGSVCLLEAATGRPIGEALIHGSAVSAIAFDVGGRNLLAACLDGTARLWDLTRRAPALTLSHQAEVCCVGFRPGGGGDVFVTACADGTARLWEASTGRPIGEPLVHRARVDRLAFRPDGTMVATGSADGVVRLWCAASGLPIGPPLAQGGVVRALAFSRDGRRLAVGGSDATVRCWKAPDPVQGDVERISCWVSVTTELEFDAGDAVRHLDGPAFWDLRRRLDDLGGAPPPVGRRG
jgi:WD40 repeat protein/serine/threonine protein kinase